MITDTRSQGKASSSSDDKSDKSATIRSGSEDGRTYGVDHARPKTGDRSSMVSKPLCLEVVGPYQTQAFWSLDATLAQPQLLTEAFLITSFSCFQAPLSLLFPTCNSALDMPNCHVPVASGCSPTCFIGNQEKGFRIQETSVIVQTRSNRREEELTDGYRVAEDGYHSMDLRRNRQSLHESTPVPYPLVHTSKLYRLALFAARPGWNPASFSQGFPRPPTHTTLISPPRKTLATPLVHCRRSWPRADRACLRGIAQKPQAAACGLLSRRLALLGESLDHGLFWLRRASPAVPV